MISAILATILLAFTTTKAVAGEYLLGSTATLAERSFSLENRYPVKSVSDVFRDNILLTLNYMDSRVETRGKIDWAKVGKPTTYSFTLQPGETFAFHNDVLPQFQGKVVKTMDAHFNWDDGFKSDGWLTGDGVCHLASFMNLVARDAGLAVVSPTRHDFAAIPEVSKEFGVSIFQNPSTPSANAQQNLYITDNKDKPVTFAFVYDGTNLDVKVTD